MFSIRKPEHKEEAEEASERYTIGKDQKNLTNESAIVDHVTQMNHFIVFGTSH